MQSRRDQVQAYFFTVGRLVSALMRGRPDERATPTRRFATGTIVGVLIAAVVTAGFGIFGAMRTGSSTAWQQEGVVTVEQETGARYVTLGGVLHPALNYSSALLASNEDYQQPATVSQQSLRTAPRGTPVGIADAPDSLPDPQDPAALSQQDWSACATEAAGTPGGQEPSMNLHVGEPAGNQLPNDEGVLVSTSDDTKYLVWNGKKLRVPDATAAKLSGTPGSTPYPVSERWINAVPSGGSDLTAPRIPGIGSTSSSGVGGASGRVGTIYEVRNKLSQPREQYFVVLPDGLLQVNRTTANLLLSDPETAAAYPGGTPEPVRGGPDLLSAPRSSTSLPPEYQDLPKTIRHHQPGSNQTPCAAFDVRGGGEVNVRMVQGGSPGTRATGGAPGTAVSIPPGAGVLLREQAVPGGPPGNAYLVDQLGVKYALLGQAQEKLGYEKAPTATVPSALLDVLPAGPALDPTTAQRPQPTGSSATDRE